MEKLTARSSADKNENEDNYAGCEYVCNPGSVSPTLQPHLCFSAEVSEGCTVTLQDGLLTHCADHPIGLAGRKRADMHPM